MTTLPNQPQALETAIKKHFNQNSMPDFGNFLFDKILSRLNYERQLKNLRPKLWAAVGIFLGGLVLLGIAATAFWRAFVQTPTSHYLALVFTDFGLIAANWQDYSLGVLGSLPLGTFFILLASVLGSMLLVDFAAHRFIKFRKTVNLLHYETAKN